jgi:FtsH-binding integral membrane protein
MLAQGGQGLSSGLMGLVLFILFPVFLLNFKLNRTGELIISIVYIVAVIITFGVLQQIANEDNMPTINIAIVIAPVTIVLLSYLGLRKRFKKV